MDFDFSSEQYMFRDSVKAFLDNEYDLDRVRDLTQGDRFDRALLQKLAGLGIFALLVPEALGGLGLSFIDLSLILEAFGQALLPAPVGETLACIDALVAFGTSAQQQTYLSRASEGRFIAVPAITETDSGFDVNAANVTAERCGENWRVSGRKRIVPHAASADIMLVTLRLGRGGDLAVAIIPPDRPGVRLFECTTLDNAGRYFDLDMRDVIITATDLLEGQDGSAAQRLFDSSAVIAASFMAGIAGKMLDMTIAYVTQRVQFGKPIGSFQAVKHRCADMAVALNFCRPAAYYAAWALAERAADLPQAVSLAKAACGDAVRFICNEGIQLHGGMGFTWDLGLHYYLRRAKMLEYSYGDGIFHRERLLRTTLVSLSAGT